MASEKIIIPLAITAGLIFLLSSPAGEDSDSSPSESASDYVKRYLPLAKLTEQYYAVPAVFTLAQGGLESAWGGSNIALNANNHFGIKADSNWYGPTFSGYRKYKIVADSFDDHGKFLTTNDRYSAAFDYSDPLHFAQAVADAGYSENPNYYSILSRAIDSVSKLV